MSAIKQTTKGRPREKKDAKKITLYLEAAVISILNDLAAAGGYSRSRAIEHFARRAALLNSTGVGQNLHRVGKNSEAILKQHEQVASETYKKPSQHGVKIST